MQGRPPTLERSRGFWKEGAVEGPLRPFSLLGKFLAKSTEIGNPGDFRPQQNSQSLFSSGLLRTPRIVGLSGRVQAISIGGRS